MNLFLQLLYKLYNKTRLLVFNGRRCMIDNMNKMSFNLQYYENVQQTSTRHQCLLQRDRNPFIEFTF